MVKVLNLIKVIMKTNKMNLISKNQKVFVAGGKGMVGKAIIRN